MLANGYRRAVISLASNCPSREREMGRTILVLEDNLITLGVVEAILRQRFEFGLGPDFLFCNCFRRNHARKLRDSARAVERSSPQ